MRTHDDIKTQVGGIWSELFLALNHYISTSDHMGVGIVMEEPGGSFLVQIPYAHAEEQDSADWRKLDARLKQIVADGKFKIEIVNLGRTPPSKNGRTFTVMAIRVPGEDKAVEDLTTALITQPGPLGWGSMRDFLVKQGVVPPWPEGRE